MKELTLIERQQLALAVLEHIDLLCRTLSLNYSLTGGTLLGAVRHKGFIPWDDDIDILMPRSDFETLKSYFLTNSDPLCHWVSYDTDDRYGYFFAKIVHSDTFVIDPFCNFREAPLGVAVDVFPVDELGETQQKAEKNINKIKGLIYLLIASNWGKYFRSFSRPWYVEPIRLMLFVLSRLTKPRWLINKINEVCEIPSKKKKKFWGIIMFANNRYVHEKTFFQDYHELEFEGRRFQVLKLYEQMLTELYGDYMKLPPKEKRMTHHHGHFYHKLSNDKQVNPQNEPTP